MIMQASPTIEHIQNNPDEYQRSIIDEQNRTIAFLLQVLDEREKLIIKQEKRLENQKRRLKNQKSLLSEQNWVFDTMQRKNE
jgi:hypothetical protein